MKGVKRFLLAVIILGVCFYGNGPVGAKACQIENNTSGWLNSRSTVRIPILMYHSISTGKNSLHVPPQTFREQMKWLKDHHYMTLTPNEAYIALTTNKKPAEKCVLITLDDGYEDNFTAAYPILKQYHEKATVFMIGHAINKKNFLTAQQLKEMDQNGISIESHTMDHPDLRQLSPAQAKAELKDSKALLEKMLHKKMTILSYPYGRFNSKVEYLAKQTGYKMAVTTWPGSASLKQGLFALHRIRITPEMSLEGFGRIMEGAQ